MTAINEAIDLKKRVRGWMMFDWATQPFFTLGLTFIFGPYFAVVAAEAFLNNGMDKDTAAASAQTIWSWGQAIAGIFVAIIGILAGAYADSTGRRMPWIWAASIVFVICTWLLWYMVPDGSAMWSSLIIFSIAFVAAEFAAVFTNAILPSLGPTSRSWKNIRKWNGFRIYWGHSKSIYHVILFL